jgi:hypothetical protein
VHPEPIGASSENTAATQIVHLRPKRLLIGSEIQAVIKAIAMYGHALMKPMIQLFFSHVPAASHFGPESGIPKDSAKVKFAPLEPVWSHP